MKVLEFTVTQGLKPFEHQATARPDNPLEGMAS